MRILRDASDGDECLILGVLNVDEAIRGEKKTKTYNSIAKTLANRYATIYFIDLSTNHYVEYSASDDYRELEVPEEGSDFFAETYRNIQRVIHPEDLEAVQKISDKAYMISVTGGGRRYRIEYRLIMKDGTHYVRLVAVRTEDNGNLIIALENIDNEKRNQEEMKAISEEKLIFSQIAEGLAEQYGMIYYIDTETNNYIEFTAAQEYKKFNINPEGSDFFGTSQRNVSQIIHPADRERVFDALDKKTMLGVMKDNETFTMTYRLLLGGGSSCTRMSVFWANDRRHLIMAVMNIEHEMEKQRALEKTLEENATFYQIATSLANQYDTIYYVDMLNDHYIEFSSTDVYKSLDVRPSGDDFFRESVLNTERVIYPDDREAFLNIMDKSNMMEVLKVMKEEKELREIPVIVMTADQGAEVECLKYGAIDFIPKPYPTAEIVRARVHRCIELSEKRNIIETTERDSLTNLFNLDYFLRYVRMYDQHYADMSMDAIVLDVNHFHVLNERYGKQYGDSVLARIGSRIRQIAREVGGVGCRRGADTFLIYCPHREDYESLLDKVTEGLAGEDVSENRVRLRMGVYAEADKTIEIERRFDYAKVAANTVKSGYLKPVGIYDAQMREMELYKARLLEDFKPSLRSGRFMVYFQPKFDIRPDKPLLASAEALVRWDHPELGMLSHLPIDALKLDMSFVRSAFGEKRDVRMIELIIDIADYLHVPVVAEGVETEEQYLVLKAMGCDLVQGYYFSKPVPGDAFDHFLTERAQVEEGVTPEARKTYVSISKALTSNFQSIFYVDVVTDCYLEFYTGKDGELEIRPGGVDFFGEARRKLLDDVLEADRERVREATGKASLMRWIGQEEPMALSFHRLMNGQPVAHSLQTIRTRESDETHIVIGVKQE